MDTMGAPRNHKAKINIHLGATYGDKTSAVERFINNFQKLPDSVKSRLTLENDDKKNMYSTHDLYSMVYKRTGIPIVFDYHHHKFCNDQDLSEQEALEMAGSTWPEDITQTCHYSESALLKENKQVMPNAHSDYIYEEIQDYGNNVDIIVEAKKKEEALFKYFDNYGRGGCAEIQMCGW